MLTAQLSPYKLHKWGSQYILHEAKKILGRPAYPFHVAYEEALARSPHFHIRRLRPYLIYPFNAASKPSTDAVLLRVASTRFPRTDSL
jgi:hypothetical protein